MKDTSSKAFFLDQPKSNQVNKWKSYKDKKIPNYLELPIYIDVEPMGLNIIGPIWQADLY